MVGIWMIFLFNLYLIFSAINIFYLCNVKSKEDTSLKTAHLTFSQTTQITRASTAGVKASAWPSSSPPACQAPKLLLPLSSPRYTSHIQMCKLLL